MRLVETIDALNDLLAGTSERPALIFKHSLSCGTSAMAMEEMTDLVAAGPLDAEFALVRVQAARAVSDAIATRLKVRHESPQVLLVRDGQVVWSATHWNVTARSVQAALVQLTAPASRS
jgi:bacillithiol system protein YtxJ